MYVFELVCRDLEKFHQKGRGQGKASIQLSRLLFLDDHLGKRLQKIMDRYGVMAEEIELELDEKAVSTRDIDKLVLSMKIKGAGFFTGSDPLWGRFLQFPLLAAPSGQQP